MPTEHSTKKKKKAGLDVIIPIHLQQETGELKWQVQCNQPVVQDQVLGTLHYPIPDKSSDVYELRAEISGIIQLQYPNNTRVHPNLSTPVLAIIELCEHALLKRDLCMVCLQRVSKDEKQDAVKVMFSHGQKVTMNRQAAEELDHKTITRQLEKKKLSLVLDLDHTLLHATPSLQAEQFQNPDIYSFELDRANGGKAKHFVKLRPGLAHFLQDSAQLYDLHIYTHGTREYAMKVVEIIDPDHKLFHQRIVTRTDTQGNSQKQLKLLFPSRDDSMILVLDDRLDVWQENMQNVVLVEPYIFFAGMKDVNNSSGPTGRLTPADATDEDDKCLEYVASLIKRVHERFYGEGCAKSADEQLKGEGNDVKDLMGKIQKSVFQGCVIIFSGVFQVGEKAPQKHPLWKMAERFGARIVLKLDENVTHLILHPARAGTDKHKKAMKMANVHVVDPAWIVECVKRWDRVDEHAYDIKDLPKQVAEQNLMKQEDSKEILAKLKAKANASAKEREKEKKIDTRTRMDKEVRVQKKTNRSNSSKRKVRFADKNEIQEIPRAQPKVSAASKVSNASDDFLAKIKKNTRQRSPVVKKQKTAPNAPKVLIAARAEAAKRAKASDDDIFSKLLEAENAEEHETKSPSKRNQLFQDRHKNRPFIPRSDAGEEDEENLDSLEDELFA